MGDKDVGPGLAGGCQQDMQIGDRSPRRRGLRDRVAPARLLADRRSRTIIGTDPGEPGDLGKHPRPWLPGNIPILGGPSEAGHQHDGRGSGAATLQIHLATAADVDQAGEISAWRGMRGRRGQRGEERNKKQGDASAKGHESSQRLRTTSDGQRMAEQHCSSAVMLGAPGPGLTQRIHSLAAPICSCLRAIGSTLRTTHLPHLPIVGRHPPEQPGGRAWSSPSSLPPKLPDRHPTCGV